MEQIDGEIAKVELAIVRVEAEIEKTEKRLEAEDVAYLRGKNEQLRKEEEQLREEKLLLMKREPPQRREQPLDVELLKTPPLDDESTLQRIERKLDDMATVDMEMSEATQDFTRELLGARGIVFKTLPVRTEVLDDTFSDGLYCPWT